MSPSLGYQGILALELVLVWASFSPIFPLLTAPRREAHEVESEPSPAPRLLVAALATAAVTAAAASAASAVAAARKAGTSTWRTPPSSSGLRGREGGGLFKGRAALSRGAVGLVAGAFVIHAGAVMLGAPVLRRTPETAVFSLLMASLTSLPVSVSSQRSLEACTGFLLGTRPAVHESRTMVPAAGCALGAWLGAIPLCLDWEQPWQGWPLPMCAGGLLGFSLGCLLLLGEETVHNVRRHLSSWRGAEKRA
eukprot:g11122.t1